jgi:plasmid stability protein
MAAPFCNQPGESRGRTAVANLTIKNLPREVHRSLKERARRHRRSLNSEVIEILAGSIPSPAVDPEKILARIAAINRRFKHPPMTHEEIQKARTEGRL